jgi:hypothetical protein
MCAQWADKVRTQAPAWLSWPAVTAVTTSVLCMLSSPCTDWWAMVAAPCIATAVWYYATDVLGSMLEDCDDVATDHPHKFALASAAGGALGALTLPVHPLVARIGAGYAYWTWVGVDAWRVLRDDDHPRLPHVHVITTAAAAAYGCVAIVAASTATPGWLHLFWGAAEAAHAAYLLAHTPMTPAAKHRVGQACAAAAGVVCVLWFW